jgi:Xaa-Pro aminopeptidase/Xaa-Pro dipeptidase
MRFDTDWREGIDYPGLRRYRHERTQAAMARAGLDAVIAFEYASCRYIAGLRPLWAPNFMVRQAVVSVRGCDDVIVFVHQDDTPHRRKTMTWIAPERIRAFPTGVVSETAPLSALKPLADALTELGCHGGRVGVDIATVTVIRRLEELLDGYEIVDANAALSGARLVKSPTEVDLLDDASSIVDLAMATVERVLEPGVRECDILAEVMHVFYTHGAEVPQCNLIVCSGPNTAPMQRFAGDRVIRRGDLVFVDIGACFNGIFSEATRTIACGEPDNDTQRAIYRTVYDIHMSTIEALRPGATAVQVQAAAHKHYESSPFVGYMQEMIIAHGIGVGYAEPPFIAPPGKTTPDLVLEPGMVLAVVPTVIVPDVPGGGGVRLEDVVVVTDNGARVLTRAPYSEPLLSH